MCPTTPSTLPDSRAYATVSLRTPALATLPWLAHGFSNRWGGVSRRPGNENAELNLGNVAWDQPGNVEENRRRFLESLTAGQMRQVLQEQIHSDLIRVLERPPANPQRMRGDGLVTARPGMLLSILAADCLPVLLVDTRQRVVAALHCGWRGTVGRLAQKGVGVMRQRFGSRPKDLLVAIGPGIRACCYEVGEEVTAEFESQFVYSPALLSSRLKPRSAIELKHALLFQSPFRPLPARSAHSIHLDLVEANRRQLQEAGLSTRQIFSDAPCTSCHPEWFFSHRRDAGRTGRMMGVIGIR
jgi:YfiH family protein